MSDSNEGGSDTRKSVFPKLEAGDRRKNIAWMSIYAIVWPLGVAAMLRGFRRANNYEKIRVMGTGEKLLTVWLSIALIFAVLGVLGVGIGAYDAISSGEISDWSPSTDPAASTATPSDNTVRCWLANHPDEMEEASQQLQDGNSALEEGDGSRSLMHLENAVNRYESLNESAHDAPFRNETRERLLEGYFHATLEGTAATYLGVYELQVNDDAAAAERKAELQEQYFDTASQRRQALKESMGVSQSTDLTEISTDC